MSFCSTNRTQVILSTAQFVHKSSYLTRVLSVAKLKISLSILNLVTPIKSKAKNELLSSKLALVVGLLNS
jgi:hypothetical protein